MLSAELLRNDRLTKFENHKSLPINSSYLFKLRLRKKAKLWIVQDIFAPSPGRCNLQLTLTRLEFRLIFIFLYSGIVLDHFRRIKFRALLNQSNTRTKKRLQFTHEDI